MKLFLNIRYVEWSLHNFDEGKYWWGSNADLEKFIKTAEEVGLYVILRPGPYICAERDFVRIKLIIQIIYLILYSILEYIVKFKPK